MTERTQYATLVAEIIALRGSKHEVETVLRDISFKLAQAEQLLKDTMEGNDVLKVRVDEHKLNLTLVTTKQATIEDQDEVIAALTELGHEIPMTEPSIDTRALKSLATNYNDLPGLRRYTTTTLRWTPDKKD